MRGEREKNDTDVGTVSVSGIVLAGGYSSRMGRSKAELEFGGRSFLRHQVLRLRQLGITDILISGDVSLLEKVENVRYVPDVLPHGGPVSGLHACLPELRHPAALVLAVDTPLVPLSLLRELIQGYRPPVTVVRSPTGLEPLIGVYGQELGELFGRCLQESRRSLWRILQELDCPTVEYTGDPELLMNCNTPEEYEILQKNAGNVKTLSDLRQK